MSGNEFTITSGEVALTANTAKTVLFVTAPANIGVLLREWKVHAKGIDPVGTPLSVRLMRPSDAGTGGTSITPAKWNGAAETVQTAAKHSPSAEPTYANVHWHDQVHPQNGYGEIYPEGQELRIPGGGYWAIVVLSTANITVSASARLVE